MDINGDLEQLDQDLGLMSTGIHVMHQSLEAAQNSAKLFQA